MSAGNNGPSERKRWRSQGAISNAAKVFGDVTGCHKLFWSSCSRTSVSSSSSSFVAIVGHDVLDIYDPTVLVSSSAICDAAESTPGDCREFLQGCRDRGSVVCTCKLDEIGMTSLAKKVKHNSSTTSVIGQNLLPHFPRNSSLNFVESLLLTGPEIAVDQATRFQTPSNLASPRSPSKRTATKRFTCRRAATSSKKTSDGPAPAAAAKQRGRVAKKDMSALPTENSSAAVSTSARRSRRVAAARVITPSFSAPIDISSRSDVSDQASTASEAGLSQLDASSEEGEQKQNTRTKQKPAACTTKIIFARKKNTPKSSRKKEVKKEPDQDDDDKQFQEFVVAFSSKLHADPLIASFGYVDLPGTSRYTRQFSSFVWWRQESSRHLFFISTVEGAVHLRYVDEQSQTSRLIFNFTSDILRRYRHCIIQDTSSVPSSSSEVDIVFFIPNGVVRTTHQLQVTAETRSLFTWISQSGMLSIRRPILTASPNHSGNVTLFAIAAGSAVTLWWIEQAGTSSSELCSPFDSQAPRSSALEDSSYDVGEEGDCLGLKIFCLGALHLPGTPDTKGECMLANGFVTAAAISPLQVKNCRINENHDYVSMVECCVYLGTGLGRLFCYVLDITRKVIGTQWKFSTRVNDIQMPWGNPFPGPGIEHLELMVLQSSDTWLMTLSQSLSVSVIIARRRQRSSGGSPETFVRHHISNGSDQQPHETAISAVTTWCSSYRSNISTIIARIISFDISGAAVKWLVSEDSGDAESEYPQLKLLVESSSVQWTGATVTPGEATHESEMHYIPPSVTLHAESMKSQPRGVAMSPCASFYMVLREYSRGNGTIPAGNLLDMLLIPGPALPHLALMDAIIKEVLTPLKLTLDNLPSGGFLEQLPTLRQMEETRNPMRCSFARFSVRHHATNLNIANPDDKIINQVAPAVPTLSLELPKRRKSAAVHHYETIATAARAVEISDKTSTGCLEALIEHLGNINFFSKLRQESSSGVDALESFGKFLAFFIDSLIGIETGSCFGTQGRPYEEFSSCEKAITMQCIRYIATLCDEIAEALKKMPSESRTIAWINCQLLRGLIAAWALSDDFVKTDFLDESGYATIWTALKRSFYFWLRKSGDESVDIARLDLICNALESNTPITLPCTYCGETATCSSPYRHFSCPNSHEVPACALSLSGLGGQSPVYGCELCGHYMCTSSTTVTRLPFGLPQKCILCSGASTRLS